MPILLLEYKKIQISFVLQAFGPLHIIISTYGSKVCIFSDV